MGRIACRPATVVLLLLLAVLVLASARPAVAQTPPRGALHEGYARLVFDWSEPVNYSADVINGELVLRFDHPVSGDFRAVLRPLANYLRSVSISADHKTATLPLAHPVQVKAFAGKNNSVVIDLVDLPGSNPASASNQPPPSVAGAAGPVSLLPSAPAPLPAAPSTANSSGSAARTASPERAGGSPTVAVRAGEHGTYNRLVFDWPQAVDYEVKQQGGRATIVFARPARLDMAGVRGSLPSDIGVLSTSTGSRATTVVLSVPKTARLRHFLSGKKVVVDVVRAADSRGPADAAEEKTPLAPPPGADVALPALRPLLRQERPTLPSESLAAAGPGPSPVKSVPEAKSRGKHASAPTATVQAAGLPPKAAAAPTPAAPEKVFSLSVSWDKPVAAAVFERAGYLWVVFDRHEEVDTALLHRLGGEAVKSVEQLPVKEATVLRLVVQPDYTPSVRRDGLLWVIDLINRPGEPRQPIAVTAPASLPSGIGISLAVADAGSVVSLADPEVGDRILVVPVIPLGAGVYPGHSTPDLDLLPTTQGVAIVPHVDGLEVKSSRSGVTIGLPEGAGLVLSTDIGAGAQEAKLDTSGSFFDVAGWKRGGPDKFDAERRILQAGLAEVPKARRGLAHLQAARFFFANGYAAEALGYLRIAASDEPTLVDTGAFRALRGAAETLMGQWDLAQSDLDNPLLKDDAESQMWRAAAQAAVSPNPGDQDKALAVGLPLLKDYPHALKWPLAAIAAEAAIAAGDDQTAQDALAILDRETASRYEAPQLNYLHGLYEEMAGQFNKALDNYAQAADGDNREYRARASAASVELQLKLRKMNPKEAVEQLDRLRFAWRDEDFEFGLLFRLAQLELDQGDYPDALRALRSLTNNYPNDRDAPKVTKMMTDTFAKLYLDGAADSLPPVSAIALYDEFRDLTPTGPKGDEMIRKLADRLASVDLLGRAIALLKHQVTFRLQGLDKARVGSQLALLDLLDRQPQAAVEALQDSDMSGLPADLQRQRAHLKARALADLDRVPDAIQLLAGDDSAEANLLRAEIYWHKQDWLDAAAAFEALVPRPERNATLDDASAKLVLSWATALSLGNDERGLAMLRRVYGPAMAGTSYQDGFSLLTSALDRDLPDMPAIAAKIKEAEGFQSFMSNYRKRMQTAGLSAIN